MSASPLKADKRADVWPSSLSAKSGLVHRSMLSFNYHIRSRAGQLLAANLPGATSLNFVRRVGRLRGHTEAANMAQKLSDRGLRLLAGASLMMIFACTDLQAQEGQRTRNDGIGKPPYNIVFLIVDQRTYRLLAGPDYSLPGIDAIARHSVTFQNHYISSAMCSPSRASFLTGQPPQVTGVIGTKRTWPDVCPFVRFEG